MTPQTKGVIIVLAVLFFIYWIPLGGRERFKYKFTQRKLIK